MKLHLLITKKSDPDWNLKKEYSQDEVVIGREKKCDLFLEEKYVGRQHAKLLKKGNCYVLVDLNSKNFTFLNDEQIKAGHEYPLNNGDQIRIVEYNITTSFLQDELETDEKTRYFRNYPNPFVEEITDLTAILIRINEKFINQGTENRELLEIVLKESFERFEQNEIWSMITGTSTQKQSSSAPIQMDKQSFPYSERLFSIISLIMNSFLNLHKGRRRFRLEFIGETMLESTKTFSLSNCTAEELRAFLLEDCSEEEIQKRIAVVEKAIKDLMIHQVALLDGYKDGVTDGTHKILQEMDPNSIKDQISRSTLNLGPIKIPVRFLPGLYHIRIFQMYLKKYSLLAKENRGLIEKKLFRPGFINGYLERVSSPGHVDVN